MAFTSQILSDSTATVLVAANVMPKQMTISAAAVTNAIKLYVYEATTAAGITVGTTAPDQVIACPDNDVRYWNPTSRWAGMVVAAVDNDGTAPFTAGDVTVTLEY